jgi:hypothetical protein
MVVNIYMDYGGYLWRMHHNVFWTGQTIDGSRQTAHFMPNLNTIASVQLYNNTMIDADPAHDWERWTIEGSRNVLVVAAGGDTASWRFSDPVKRNYSLRAGSPAIDAGTAVPGVSLSYSGAAPDLGAYEFGQTPWTAGADWQETPWVYPPSTSAVADRTPRAIGDRTSAPRIRVALRSIALSWPDAGAFRVRIFNARGACVADAMTEAGLVSVPTLRLGAGAYLLSIVSKSGVYTSRMLLRKQMKG